MLVSAVLALLSAVTAWRMIGREATDARPHAA
jgi:hypothetical protein